MYEDLMQKHGFIPFNREKPNFFPVEVCKVYDEVRKVIPGYQAVRRKDTGDTLKIHTNSYKLVPYEVSFGAFEDAIYASGLNTKNMRVSTDMMNNGGKVFRQYLFPEIIERINNESSIALTINMFDSYDGSCSFTGFCGFFDFNCANMARAGRTALEMRVKHMGDETHNRQMEAIRLIVEAADRFIVEAKRMREWPKIQLPVENVRKLLESMPQITEQLTDTLLASYAVEKEKNLWRFYSCLTHWATHVPDAKSKKTSVDRQKRILDLVEGRDWKQLETV